ncbi:hypothetical protein E4U24_008350 [Claviceps purpurea]|nr:hypothetical protein E4U24_008350 [Claviceps purpurea]
MLPAAKIAGARPPKLRAKSPPTGEFSKFQYGIPLDLRATVLTMVKILPFFLTTLAAISPVAQAAAKPATCTPGLDYCGSVLIKSKGSGKEAHLKLKLNRHDQGLTLFSLRLVGKGC